MLLEARGNAITTFGGRIYPRHAFSPRLLFWYYQPAFPALRICGSVLLSRRRPPAFVRRVAYLLVHHVVRSYALDLGFEKSRGIYAAHAIESGPRFVSCPHPTRVRVVSKLRCNDFPRYPTTMVPRKEPDRKNDRKIRTHTTRFFSR